MEFDYSKLIGRITEIYKTQSRFSKDMGLSERSVSLKLNGNRKWKQDEIAHACDLLHISFSEIPLYFFTLKVQSV